ncbi:MAG: D-glycerate dehydrogenase, partial [Alphaproteobacteria bacterium]
MMNSQKPVVVVTRKLPQAIEARMMELFDARFNFEDLKMDDEALVAAMQKADVLVPTVTDHITADLIARAGDRLKLI